MVGTAVVAMHTFAAGIWGVKLGGAVNKVTDL